MKTKYERMTKEEKRELFNEYKEEKPVFVNKMKKMFVLSYLGIGYGIVMFIFDFFFRKSKVESIFDIVICVVCTIVLLKLISTRKDLLNRFALKKDKKRKQEIVKKYKK